MPKRKAPILADWIMARAGDDGQVYITLADADRAPIAEINISFQQYLDQTESVTADMAKVVDERRRPRRRWKKAPVH